MFNRKNNTADSNQKKSTKRAASGLTGRDHIRRAASAMLEPLETRLLMSYTFIKLADLSTTTGSHPQAGLYIDSRGDLFGTTTTGGQNNHGTLYEIPAGSSSVTTLYNFSSGGTNPYQPYGGLIADSSGNLYGVTNLGGAGYGAIYEFNPDTDVFTTLASFNTTDGANPQGSLYMDSSGNLYGTASNAGANNKGVIFELPHNSGTIQVLASFAGTSNGQYPKNGNVVMDSAGNLYGVGYLGGANGMGDVWELAHNSSNITDLVDFAGTSNGAVPYAGLAMDSAGNMYGTTFSGGTYNFGTVFKVAAGTHTFTTLANLSATTGEYPESSLLVDSSGNIFGTTTQGGSQSDGTVFEIPATNTSTLNVLVNLSSATGGFPFDATPVMDASGNIYDTAEVGGQNSDGTIFELSPPQAVFTTAPTSFAAGSSQSFAVSLDANGAVSTSSTGNVTLSIGSGPAGAAIGGTLTEPAVAGVASFSGLTFTEAGTYTLTASSSGFASATSATITVTPAAPSKLVIAQPPTNTTAGQSIGAVVNVEDAFGNIVTSDNSTVALSLIGTGSINGGLTAQAVDGVATFSGLSIDQSGDYTLSASDGSLASVSTNPITISTGPASQLVITTEPTTSVDAGKSIGTVAVAIEDAYGNIVTGDDSAVTLSGASSLAGTTTAAASNGVATFSNLVINSPGTFTLTASDGTLTPADTDPITVAIGNVVIAGHTIKPIAINTQTAFGQSTAKMLTLSVQSQADGAVVLKKKFHVKNGKATISNLKLHQAGNYTLVIADAQGQTTTQQLTVMPAVAKRLAFVTQPVSLNGSEVVRVQVTDQYGNACNTATGTLVTLHLGPHAALGSHPKLTGTLTAEVVNGVATFQGISVHHTGRGRLWATAKGLLHARSNIFTNV